MAAVRFEWDPAKAVVNGLKHGVTFDEAETAFGDERGLLIADPDHSIGEERFVLIGMSSALQVLVVSHCYRSSGEVVRIISARAATPQERAQYAWRRLT